MIAFLLHSLTHSLLLSVAQLLVSMASLRCLGSSPSQRAC
jgi:hypothetical protein